VMAAAKKFDVEVKESNSLVDELNQMRIQIALAELGEEVRGGPGSGPQGGGSKEANAATKQHEKARDTALQHAANQAMQGNKEAAYAQGVAADAHQDAADAHQAVADGTGSKEDAQAASDKANNVNAEANAVMTGVGTDKSYDTLGMTKK
jgi:hypothetical protein